MMDLNSIIPSDFDPICRTASALNLSFATRLPPKSRLVGLQFNSEAGIGAISLWNRFNFGNKVEAKSFFVDPIRLNWGQFMDVSIRVILMAQSAFNRYTCAPRLT